MSVTLEEITAALNPDEPDYRGAAALGPEVLPHLETLMAGDPATGLPAKAAYLAGLIDHPDAARTVAHAAESADPLVRVAAAGTLSNLPAEAREEIAAVLLEDSDVGVRKVVLNSMLATPVEVGPDSRMSEKVRDLVENEENEILQQLATDLAQQLNG